MRNIRNIALSLVHHVQETAGAIHAQRSGLSPVEVRGKTSVNAPELLLDIEKRDCVVSGVRDIKNFFEG